MIFCNENREHFGLDQRKLVAMAILMGSDFAKGVKYIGFKNASNGITTAIEEMKFGLFLSH